jgi:hypothetical protein
MNKLVLPNEVMLGEVSALLAEGKEVVIMTKGVSMLPFIRGEIDSVALAQEELFEEGDIVLAEISKGHYVLHRVRRIAGDGVVLKGDGNLRGIERCPASAVRGVVRQIIRPRRKVDPHSPWQMRLWRIWCSLPQIVRRGILGIERRIIY